MGPDAGDELDRRIAAGDAGALVELFARNRDRLGRMVRLRLDRRLAGRIDPSDVLQEAHLEVARRAGEYVLAPALPAFLWLRAITGDRLQDAHRRHLGTRAQDVRRGVAPGGPLPRATSEHLAAMLLGRLTSPTRAAVRAEMRARLHQALDALGPIDREVLTLRHFEELSNAETARVLGLEKTAASNRYIRALRRLKDALGDLPESFVGGRDDR